MRVKKPILFPLKKGGILDVFILNSPTPPSQLQTMKPYLFLIRSSKNSMASGVYHLSIPVIFRISRFWLPRI